MATTIQDFDFSYEADELITKEHMSSRFTKFMAIAKEVSELSTFDRYRLGAIITFKGVVVARGWNKHKSHPKQKHYNQFRTNLIEGTQVVDAAQNYLHAELDAINKAKRAGIDLSKCELTVFRCGLDKKQKMARPCPGCMGAIKDEKIPVIRYSTPDGMAVEYLDINKPTRVKNATKMM